jgi:hypothetical protein
MATAIDPISHAPIERGSDRNFGFVFAGVFTVVACLPLLSRHEPRWWALAVAAAFATVAVAQPAWLAPLNRLWAYVGMMLSRVVSPVVLGLIFFVCVTPTALILRLTGKDILGLRWERRRKSYWLAHSLRGEASDTMKNQF